MSSINQQILNRLRKGMSHRQISRILNVSSKRVATLARHHGIPVKGVGRAPTIPDNVVMAVKDDLVGGGVTMAQIAEKHCIGTTTVHLISKMVSHPRGRLPGMSALDKLWPAV